MVWDKVIDTCGVTDGWAMSGKKIAFTSIEDLTSVVGHTGPGLCTQKLLLS